MSESPAHEGKRVTWAELFFDLVFVLALVQVSGLLGEHHQWWGVARAAIVLVPVYITWAVLTLQNNRLGHDRVGGRIGLFAVGASGTIMAIAVPKAYDDGGLLFALAYLVARLTLLFRYPSQTSRNLRMPFATALAVTGPLVLVGAFQQDTLREVLWAIAAVIDLSIPLLASRRLPKLRYDGHHLAERYGLLVIIALGESLIDLSLPLAHQQDLVSATEIFGVLAAFVMVCGLWWTYFDAFNRSLGGALHSTMRNAPLSYRVLYGHLGIIGGIIVVAVGFENMITRPSEPMTLTHLSLLYGGTASYLVSVTYVWWVAARRISLARLVAAVVIVALLPVGLLLSGQLATVLAAVVLVGLTMLERGGHPTWGAPALDEDEAEAHEPTGRSPEA